MAKTKFRQPQDSDLQASFQKNERLVELYAEWAESERRAAGRSSKEAFAASLGYDSHSAVLDMLNGKRLVAAWVLVKARAAWGISPDWLLGGDGPMYVYQTDAEGDALPLEHALSQRLKLAIERASTAELPMDHGRAHYDAIGLRVGVDVGGNDRYAVDGTAALAVLEELTIAEAKDLHRWRATWGAVMHVKTMPSYTMLPGEDGELTVLARTNFRDLSQAPLPPMPVLRVVRGL